MKFLNSLFTKIRVKALEKAEEGRKQAADILNLKNRITEQGLKVLKQAEEVKAVVNRLNGEFDRLYDTRTKHKRKV